MKKLTLPVIMYIIALFTVALPVSAQNPDQANEYKTLLKKIMVLSGSTAAVDNILPKLTSNFKNNGTQLDEAYWKDFTSTWMKKIEDKVLEVYVPIYQRYLTLDELKKVAAFYESPAGKKLGEIVPVLMTEAMPAIQQLTTEMVTEIMSKANKTTHTFVDSGSEQRKQRDKEMFDAAYTAPKDSIEIADKFYERGMGTYPILYSIERRKNDTKVTFLQPIYFDSQWLHYSPGYKIVDKENGDEYNVRGYADGSPFGRLMIIKGFNNKYIYVSLLFPKLNKNVKVIDILELPNEKDIVPSNDDGVAKSYVNVKVKEYLPSNKKNKKVYN